MFVRKRYVCKLFHTVDRYFSLSISSASFPYTIYLFFSLAREEWAFGVSRNHRRKKCEREAKRGGKSFSICSCVRQFAKMLFFRSAFRLMEAIVYSALRAALNFTAFNCLNTHLRRRWAQSCLSCTRARAPGHNQWSIFVHAFCFSVLHAVN